MDRYGRNPMMDGSQPDPTVEWTSGGAETGLEEPMWQLGLGGLDSYPERPGEADCIYYLRTGFCGYGARCRFNHPRERSMAVGAVGRPGGGEYPERVGQPVCQYFMRTGTCKFGASCKYHHPRQGGGSVSPVALNYYGYPLRPGERECSYYIKTGQCKFGATCKFHHPQLAMLAPAPAPAAPPMPAPGPALFQPVQSPSLPSSQQYGVVTGNWQVPRPPLLPGSYVQGAYSPVLLPPGMVPFTGWSPYAAPLSPVAAPSSQPNLGTSQLYGITQLSPSAPAYTGPYSSISSSMGPSSSSYDKEHPFPERPGQPECQYYMRTGDCKFGSSCRYNHPPEWITPKTSCVLSPIGLPMRPGAPPCTYYAQHGVCKFGPTCKFDHPMGALSYSPSASSLADMPVAPYPVGSSIGTLAPSSSSSELRPELMSSRLSSSMSSSGGSVGSIFSKSGSVSQPSVPTTAGSSSSHGGEPRSSS